MADTSDVTKKEASTPEKGERTRECRCYSPAVDIIDRKKDILVVADMPGVDEKSVDITVEKNVLTIYGRVAADIPEGHWLSMLEYGVGDYQRVFTLSDEINRDGIQATVKNGTLRLILPKAEQAKARAIPVAAGS